MTAARAAVWARLVAAGIVHGEMPAAVPASTPWFVRAALGIAGWLGALCLLGFVGAAFAFVLRSPEASLVVGALACAIAAVILRRGAANDFASQFGLAVSLAGQLLLFGALETWFYARPARLAALVALQQAVLFVAIPSPVHRVWTAWSGTYAATLALQEWSLAPLAPAALVAALVAACRSEVDRPRWRAILGPLGYGLALGVLTVLTVELGKGWISSSFGEDLGHWLGSTEMLPLAVVLVAAALYLLRREGVSPASGAGRATVAGAVVVGAISLWAPGVGLTVPILVLGFAGGRRALMGLGVCGLVVYLAAYYYTLEATLLDKAMLLGAAGLVLLAARLVLVRWTLPEPEGARA